MTGPPTNSAPRRGHRLAVHTWAPSAKRSYGRWEPGDNPRTSLPDGRWRRQGRSGPQTWGNPPGGRTGRTWRTTPHRLTVMVAPAYFGIGTGERFHLGEARIPPALV